MLEWCDRQGVFYIVGISRNQRLEKLLAPSLDKAQQAFDMSQEKQKKFTDFFILPRVGSVSAASLVRLKLPSREPIPVLLSPIFKETANSFMRKCIVAEVIWKTALRKSSLIYFPAGHPVINGGRTSFVFFSHLLLERLRDLTLQGTEADDGTSPNPSPEALKSRWRYD